MKPRPVGYSVDVLKKSSLVSVSVLEILKSPEKMGVFIHRTSMLVEKGRAKRHG